MKYLFIIAMEKEAKEIIKHYNLNKIDNNYYKNGNIELLITGVSRNGVTSSLISLLCKQKLNLEKYTMINIGMSGSNNLNIGSVYLVNKSYGYHFDLTPFGMPLYESSYSPFQMDILKNEPLADCYTSDGFVLSTNIKNDALFDMELNSIITFPFKNKYSIKVVSDSLSDAAYNNFKFENKLPVIYDLVDKIMKKN